MADIVAPFWTQIRAAIGSVWTDVLPANSGGGIHRVVSAQKIEWERIPLPYCAVSFSMVEDDSGPITVQLYRLTARIAYIRADGTGTAAAIDAKLAALNDALKTYNFPDGVQWLDTLEMDSNEDEPTNAVILALNEPYSAGSLVADFWIGQTYT